MKDFLKEKIKNALLKIWRSRYIFEMPSFKRKTGYFEYQSSITIRQIPTENMTPLIKSKSLVNLGQNEEKSI